MRRARHVDFPQDVAPAIPVMILDKIGAYHPSSERRNMFVNGSKLPALLAGRRLVEDALVSGDKRVPCLSQLDHLFLPFSSTLIPL